jgi:hypothetical protein
MKTVFRLSLLLLCVFPLVVPASAEDFKPVSKEELAMKDNPAAPGAHAMILEMTDIQDDDKSQEEFYYRVKIFTDEGKKHADIEVPYIKGVTDVRDVRARTVNPDGSITPFQAKLFDKTIVKKGGVKVQAKTFTLPNVQAGSIIEYRYKFTWPSESLYNTRWVLQRDLFIKKAYFRLTPSEQTYLGSAWQGVHLPPGVEIKKGKNRAIEVELKDVPAFDEESFAPPENELKPRVDFFYRSDDFKTAVEFWAGIAKSKYEFAEDFIGKRKSIAEAAASWVGPTDNAETKLRKIYAKLEAIRNTDYDRNLTEQEQKRDKTKYNNKLDEVLKRGYGESYDLNAAMVGMARSLGYESYLAWTAQRDDTFFNVNIVNSRQLDTTVAYVKADGKEYWLDPGTPFCPFGMLPWRKTGTAALLLNDKKKANFTSTPNPQSGDAIIRRVANLKFADGMFKGEIQLVFSGQEALYRRINAKREDQQSVTQDLENDLKRMLPGGSTLKLKKVEGLADDRERLTVVYDAEVPNPPSQAGSRYMMPTSLFEHEVSPFRHESRKHPVYYSYPYQVLDAVGLTLPPEFKIEALPDQKHEDSDYGYFDIKWEKRGDQTIVMRRSFAVRGLLYPLDVYPQLRDFYSKVGSGDEENVVLRANQVAGN